MMIPLTLQFCSNNRKKYFFTYAEEKINKKYKIEIQISFIEMHKLYIRCLNHL